MSASLLKIVLGVVAGLVAVILVLVAVVALYSLYRKLVEKRVLHRELGEVTVVGSEGSAMVTLDGRPVEASFTMAGDRVPDEVAAALKLVQERYASCCPAIAARALAEWDEIAESYIGPDDREMYDKMMSLRHDPPRFLGEFTIEHVSVLDDPRSISVEYLTPWDPEHTRSAMFDAAMNLTGYAMTCAS